MSLGQRSTRRRFQTSKQNCRLYIWLSLVVWDIWELGGRCVHVGGSPPVNPSHPSGAKTDGVSSHCVNVVSISEDEFLWRILMNHATVGGRTRKICVRDSHLVFMAQPRWEVGAKLRVTAVMLQSVSKTRKWEGFSYLMKRKGIIVKETRTMEKKQRKIRLETILCCNSQSNLKASCIFFSTLKLVNIVLLSVDFITSKLQHNVDFVWEKMICTRGRKYIFSQLDQDSRGQSSINCSIPGGFHFSENFKTLETLLASL